MASKKNKQIEKFEKFIELIRAMEKNSRNVANSFAESKDYFRAAEYKTEAQTYHWLLRYYEDEDFFNKTYDLFCKKDKEDNDTKSTK